jgi:hypothetical protein
VGVAEGCHTLNFGTLRRILAFFDISLAPFEEFQILKAGTLHGTLRALPLSQLKENAGPRWRPGRVDFRELYGPGPPDRVCSGRKPTGAAEPSRGQLESFIWRWLLCPNKLGTACDGSDSRRKDKGVALFDYALGNRPSTGRGNGRPAFSPTHHAPIGSCRTRAKSWLAEAGNAKGRTSGVCSAEVLPSPTRRWPSQSPQAGDKTPNRAGAECK